MPVGRAAQDGRRFDLWTRIVMPVGRAAQDERRERRGGQLFVGYYPAISPSGFFNYFDPIDNSGNLQGVGGAVMGEGPELSLREALASGPDPRPPPGRRPPLAAIRALAVGARRGDGRSRYARASWGREHLELPQARGFTRAQTPGAARNGGFTQPGPRAAAPGRATQQRGGLAALRLPFGGGFAALGVPFPGQLKDPGALPNPDLPYILPPAIINWTRPRETILTAVIPPIPITAIPIAFPTAIPPYYRPSRVSGNPQMPD